MCARVCVFMCVSVCARASVTVCTSKLISETSVVEPKKSCLSCKKFTHNSPLEACTRTNACTNTHTHQAEGLVLIPGAEKSVKQHVACPSSSTVPVCLWVCVWECVGVCACGCVARQEWPIWMLKHTCIHMHTHTHQTQTCNTLELVKKALVCAGDFTCRGRWGVKGHA